MKLKTISDKIQLRKLIDNSSTPKNDKILHAKGKDYPIDIQIFKKE